MERVERNGFTAGGDQRRQRWRNDGHPGRADGGPLRCRTELMARVVAAAPRRRSGGKSKGTSRAPPSSRAP